MSIEEICLQLPRAEQLRLMETLWSALHQGHDEIESPEWHQQELQITAEQLSAGQMEVWDWERAKKHIAKS